MIHLRIEQRGTSNEEDKWQAIAKSQCKVFKFEFINATLKIKDLTLPLAHLNIKGLNSDQRLPGKKNSDTEN